MTDNVMAICLAPDCDHPATDHHPITGECAVEEQVCHAYVSGDGIHDSEFERCRCSGLTTENDPAATPCAECGAAEHTATDHWTLLGG